MWVTALLAALLAAAAVPAIAKAKKKRPEAVRDIGIHTLDVAARDGLVYLARTSGLVIMDVTDPASPREVGALTVPSTLYGVVLKGELAFVAAGTHGLYVMDISDPADPRRLHRHDTPGMTRQLLFQGNVAFLADSGEGLRILDLADPVRPYQLASISTRSRMRRIALRDGLLATAEGTAGVRLFDVERPRNPREIATLPVDGAIDVELAGDLLLVARGRDGLEVYRLGASDPVLIGTVEPTLPAIGVVSSGRHALVANGADGIQIVDLAAPSAPRVVSSLRLPRSLPAGRMFLDGDRLYIAADVGGYAIVDLSNVERPEVLLPRERKMRVTFP